MILAHGCQNWAADGVICMCEGLSSIQEDGYSARYGGISIPHITLSAAQFWRLNNIRQLHSKILQMSNGWQIFWTSICCPFTVRCIRRRMFLCTICALEHLCTNRQPNNCAQTVDEYFGRQFAVRLCTNGWRIFRTYVCCPFVHKRLTDISERKGK